MAEFIKQTFDEILGSGSPDLKRTMIVFSVASKGDMNRRAMAAAVLAWRALKIEPSTAITMHFGGYDDDPRELWQIPEVCSFVQRFCAKTDAHKHPQVEPQSRAWLLACGADPTQRVIVLPITVDQSVERSTEFFKTTLKPEDKKD